MDRGAWRAAARGEQKESDTTERTTMMPIGLCPVTLSKQNASCFFKKKKRKNENRKQKGNEQRKGKKERTERQEERKKRTWKKEREIR